MRAGAPHHEAPVTGADVYDDPAIGSNDVLADVNLSKATMADDSHAGQHRSVSRHGASISEGST